MRLTRKQFESFVQRCLDQVRENQLAAIEKRLAKAGNLKEALRIARTLPGVFVEGKKIYVAILNGDVKIWLNEESVVKV